MIEDKQYRTVAITYSDDKTTDLIMLVTNISYYSSYIKIQYMESIDKEATKIVAMNGVKDIAISELDKFDAHRSLMYLAERTAGTDFTKLKFCPWDGAKSSVTLNMYGRYRKPELSAYTFNAVTKIERKWNHDLRAHEILIYMLDIDQHAVMNGVGQIVVFAEEDIKSMLIQRTDMPDKTININGGKYNND